jgi:hypothetical protein
LEENVTSIARSKAYSSTLKMDATYSSESSVDYPEMHGVIAQQTEFLINVAVRTSYFTNTNVACCRW